VGLEGASTPDDPMKHTFSTGQSARILDTTEPRLADLVRKGKINPPPEISAGRRLWGSSHILQAAEHLGTPTDELRRRLGEEVSHAS
jgi:hypothetical protein